MRRLLTNDPKGIRHEVVGQLSRATINASAGFRPVAFDPYQPYPCPVCGEDAGQSDNHVPTIVSLEFTDAPLLDLITWSHAECFAQCVETHELDRDME